MPDSSTTIEVVVLVSTWIRWLGRFVAKALIVGLAFVLSLFGPVHLRVAVADGVGSVSGTVKDTNDNPVAGVRVGINATATPFVATNGSGAYTIPNVPNTASPYDVQVLAPCTRDQSKRVVVDGAETVNFTIPLESQRAGYTCALSSLPYIDGVNDVAFPTSDDDVVQVNLPFSFPFFGVNRTVANVYTNGNLNFGAVGGTAFASQPSLPNSGAPNAAIYPFWDDLIIEGGQVRTTSGGVAPNRFFVLEWFNVKFFADYESRRVSFEAVLFENGRIVFNYKDISELTEDTRERGASATVGIENGDGSAAFQRSWNQPFLDNGLAFEFVPAPK